MPPALPIAGMPRHGQGGIFGAAPGPRATPPPSTCGRMPQQAMTTPPRGDHPPPPTPAVVGYDLAPLPAASTKHAQKAGPH